VFDEETRQELAEGLEPYAIAHLMITCTPYYSYVTKGQVQMPNLLKLDGTPYFGEGLQMRNWIVPQASFHNGLFKIEASDLQSALRAAGK